jgi:hypothetical protein
VIQVGGNATLGGTLDVTLGRVILNDLRNNGTVAIPIVTGSTTGQFGNINANTDRDCEEITSTQETSDRSLVVVFSLDDTGCGDNVNQDPSFPLWSIAIIVIGALFVIGVAVVVTVMYKRNQFQRAETNRVRMSAMKASKD